MERLQEDMVSDLLVAAEDLLNWAVGQTNPPPVTLIKQTSTTVSELRRWLDAHHPIIARHRDALLRFQTLTKRERSVFALLTAGYLSKEVAAKLHISERTVKVHKLRVLRKLNLRSSGAIRFAYAIGCCGQLNGRTSDPALANSEIQF